jgi:hypothetical protein
VKQDYLLRLIEQLRQFVREMIRLREAGDYDAAIYTIVPAQEKLFGLPAQEVAQLPLDEQFRHLVQGESPGNAWDKCCAYAEMLEELGHIYTSKGDPDSANGAWHFALHILLLAAAQHPAAAPRDFANRIARLRERLGGATLPGAVADLFSAADEAGLLND